MNSWWGSLDELVRLAVQEAKARGYKRIALVNTIHQGNIAMRKAFEKNVKGQLQISLQGEFEINDHDFRSFLTKLRAKKKLDAIALFAHFGQLGSFSRQARELGIKLPFFGMNFEDQAAIAASQGALEGQWYVYPVNPDLAFTQEYYKRFPNASIFGAPNGHDAFLLLANALKKNIPPKELPYFLRNVKDAHGAFGTYSSTKDHLYSIKPVVKLVTKDGFMEIAQKK